MKTRCSSFIQVLMASTAVVGMVGCDSADPQTAGPLVDSSSPDSFDAAADGASAEPDGPRTLANGCPSESGFAGDDRCLEAPDAEEGFQLHYGPSQYADSDELEPFLLESGRETTDCFLVKTPNDRDVYVSGYQIHMRPGSHHLLANVRDAPQPDGFGECESGDGNLGLLGGSQTPTVDQRYDEAPENEGLAIRLPANSQAVINFHVVNTTEEPLLREAWFNYFYIDKSEVKGIRGNVFLTGGLGYYIEPGEKQTNTYSCSPERPVRILSLTAHMHAHATRMTAWKISKGRRSLVYESFDWSEPAVLRYDSVHENQPPDRSAQRSGGSTGMLIVEPDDVIEWECDVNNTSEQALTFRNEVYTGEMCILSGAAVPIDDPMMTYDFRCTRN